MKTNLFRKNHSSSKWGMKIMRLVLLLLPLLGRGLGGGCVLFAQNGVTVKGLNVSAGTVTFNVSWETPMPVELWSDTVWVFVDYNKNGVMERLPLLPGATLIATSPGGKVIEETGNNKGVWVAGNARDAGAFSATVKLFTTVKDVGGACVYGSNYPPVAKYNIAVENISISFTGTPPYELVLNTSSGTTSAQAYSTYNLFAGQTVQSFTDKTGAPGIIIPGYNQPQGSCTFTQPPVVGTFASFDAGAATYVSLRDERDNKVYPVVKIGGRWIMARNLNYQTGLTFNSASNQANGKEFKTYTNGTPAIGSFWCPGGHSTTSSNRTNCDVWGALYTWETAMMVDGKWSNDSRNNTDWGSDPAASTKTTSANTNNGNRGVGNIDGHGICPTNWHVPTDGEWGDLLNAMEGTGTTHNTGGTGWIGASAGSYSKSKCNCSSASYCTTDSGESAVTSWYGGPDSKPGSDKYGFRVLPSGLRYHDGSTFYHRGAYAYFWSSSAYSGMYAWYRRFGYSDATVYRNYYNRSYGFSVRCMKD